MSRVSGSSVTAFLISGSRGDWVWEHSSHSHDVKHVLAALSKQLQLNSIHRPKPLHAESTRFLHRSDHPLFMNKQHVQINKTPPIVPNMVLRTEIDKDNVYVTIA